jgi:pilus assembly protein CpaB
VTTILHRIKVLAIAQETFTEEGKPKLVKTVTLELDPRQAETLALHTHKGAVHLVLRNPLDEEIPKPAMAAPAPKPIVRTVYVQPKPAPAPPPPPPPFEVEVFRRSKKESLSFQQEQTEGN